MRRFKTGVRMVGWLLMAGGTAVMADDTLQGFVHAALQQNPGLRAMTARTAAAQAASRQARSAYLPRLNASTAYTVTDNAPQAFMMTLHQRRLDMSDPSFNLNDPGETGNIRFSMGANYRLYDGARGARTAAAGLAARMAAVQEQAARHALVHEVTRAYYHLLEAQAFVMVQTEALTSLEESLRVAGERFASGSAFKTDVLNLDVQTAQARENLIRARNGVRLAVAALNTAIGAERVPESGLPAPLLTQDVPPPADPAPGPEGRPELVISALQVRMAAEQLKAVRRERGPVLNAFGSLDWDSEDLRDPEQSYLAGAALEWEWFSGFETSARMAAAEAQFSVAEAEREQWQDALMLEWKQASLGVQEAWARLQVTSQAISSAEEALRITRARYQEGAAEIAVLLVAELGLTETRMRETSARYDYRIALSNLARASGWPAGGQAGQ